MDTNTLTNMDDTHMLTTQMREHAVLNVGHAWLGQRNDT